MPNAELPRRTLQELAVIYKLEPDTKDVIVEGSSDKYLIEWFLEDSGVDDAVVYDINTFHVDALTVDKWGAEHNNRGRIIAFAYEMESVVGHRPYLACVADADFDIFLKRTQTASNLLFTDYACMEMYAFNTRALNKYLKLNVGRFPKSGARVLAEITGVLEELFLIRLVNSTFHMNLRSVAWERSATLGNSAINFDTKDYVSRCLNKNCSAADLPRFLTEISVLRKELTSDSRNQIQGHDFVELLSWYIAQHKGFSRALPDLVQRGLFTAAAEPEGLKKEKLFATLLSRFQ